MIDAVLIGTGALQPLPGRALASAAVTIGGRTILLDCGEGTQAAAKAAGVSLLKTDAILLTHYHGDHTFGLPGLLQSMGIAGRCERLLIAGPEGLEEAMKPFLMLCPNLPYEVKLVAPAEGKYGLEKLLPSAPDGLTVSAFRTHHRDVSQGYRFDLARAGRFEREKALALGVPVTEWKRLQRGETVRLGDQTVSPEQVTGKPRKGLRLVYTGDTAFCPDMIEAAQHADLPICEATYADDEHAQLAAEYGHMTFSQAARLAKEAGAKTLWLTHFSPRIENPADYEANARCLFEGAFCGVDGMRTTLRFQE